MPKSKGKGMANLILMTSSECPPCKEAEAVFRERWAEEIASGEAIVANLDEDEGAYEFWATHELPFCPTLIVVSDSGRLITTLDPMEELKEASPVAAETEEALTESSE